METPLRLNCKDYIWRSSALL